MVWARRDAEWDRVAMACCTIAACNPFRQDGYVPTLDEFKPPALRSVPVALTDEQERIRKEGVIARVVAFADALERRQHGGQKRN